MTGVHDAELMTVGPDEAVVTFRTDGDEAVTTRVGDAEVTTTGPYHSARVMGLDPGTRYALEVDGAVHGEWLPASFTTLERPGGRLLATIATANDVHFGEVECGRLGDLGAEELGPILRAEPGDPPYPQVMNGAVIEEMRALDPDVVVVKGDLTDAGTEDEFEAFLDAYGALGERMHWVRGNHDVKTDPNFAAGYAPYDVQVDGVTLAVVDTVIPGTDRGELSADQVAWLNDLAGSTSGPVLVFGHHHLWNLAADDREALAEVIARRENIAGYFSGHTHRNRVRRFPHARNVPFVEVACTKDYPGGWGEHRVYEGGYTQMMRRAAARDAMAWTEKTRRMFAGLYRDYALGPLADRCFTVRF